MSLRRELLSYMYYWKQFVSRMKLFQSNDRTSLISNIICIFIFYAYLYLQYLFVIILFFSHAVQYRFSYYFIADLN